VINTATGVDPHYLARVLEEPLVRADAEGVDSDDDATAAALKKAGKVVGKVGVSSIGWGRVPILDFAALLLS
jgi:hypothetical protein